MNDSKTEISKVPTAKSARIAAKPAAVASKPARPAAAIVDDARKEIITLDNRMILALSRMPHWVERFPLLQPLTNAPRTCISCNDHDAVAWAQKLNKARQAIIALPAATLQQLKEMLGCTVVCVYANDAAGKVQSKEF